MAGLFSKEFSLSQGQKSQCQSPPTARPAAQFPRQAGLRPPPQSPAWLLSDRLSDPWTGSCPDGPTPSLREGKLYRCVSPKLLGIQAGKKPKSLASHRPGLPSQPCSVLCSQGFTQPWLPSSSDASSVCQVYGPFGDKNHTSVVPALTSSSCGVGGRGSMENERNSSFNACFISQMPCGDSAYKDVHGLGTVSNGC